MYQVVVTMSYKGSKQRIKSTGVFMPKDKKKTVNKQKIIDQTTEFMRKNVGIADGFDREQINIKCEVSKIKGDFIIVEDKLD